MPPIKTLDYAPPPKRNILRFLITFFLLSIVGLILVALCIPKFSHGPPDLAVFVRLDLADIQRALNAFQTDTSRYPTTAEGLDALTTNPGLPSWKGPYLKKIPNDPWGNPYRYLSPTTPPDPLHPYSLSSDGKDQRPNTPDDIQPP